MLNCGIANTTAVGMYNIFAALNMWLFILGLEFKKMDPMLKLADKDINKSRLQLLDYKATRAHTQMAYL